MLLAHQPAGTIGLTLERLELAPLTERTVCSVDVLRFELAVARRACVARDREGSVTGVCCHAAPIVEAGRVTAAISVSVPVASSSVWPSATTRSSAPPRSGSRVVSRRAGRSGPRVQRVAV